MTGFKNSILNSGTVDQLNALKKLGKANISLDKFNKSLSTSIFEGNFSNFKNTELANVFNDKEMKSLFTLLDADGDNKISKDEISKLAKAGGKNGSNKIDKSDISALLKDAADYSNDVKKSSKNNGTVSKTVTKGKNGSKKVTITKADGSKVVKKYDKNGNKKSTVKTAANGDKTTTKFEYVNGHLVNSKSKTTRKVDGEKVVLKTSETRYNSKGKKELSVEKDSSGNILSNTSYIYGNNGKLKEAVKKMANGSVDTYSYDKFGHKSSRVRKNSEGKTVERADYNTKTGIISNKTKYIYDVNGNKTGTYNYTYNFKGECSNREEFDSNMNLVSKSSYKHNSDGTVIRTDKDSNGKITGSTEFKYDKFGRKESTIAKDADGNVVSTTTNDYYNSGILKSSTKVKENEDGSSINTKKSYNNDGQLSSVTKTEKAADGNVSTNTKTYATKEVGLKDLPKIDYKKLEKEYGGDGKGLADYAKKYMGYNEANGKYKLFTNGRTEAWCADFVTYCTKNYAKENGLKLKSGFGSPAVANLEAWAKNNGCFTNTKNMSNSEKLNYAKNSLKAGDIIIWTSNGRSHTGIVTGVNKDGTYTTIEGNSSDAVKTRKYSITADNTLTGFISFSKICS